tara:strand:+ start:525 stop:794 length:270 start_codon:yes stop_codon:yes gene_type:complete
MGISTLYDRVHTFDCELDADFITLDCQVSFRVDAGENGVVPQTIELVKVTTRIAGAGEVDISNAINYDFVMRLCQDELEGADVSVSDYH